MKSDGRALLWILGGLGAILLAAGLSWFFENFERRSREVDTGYSVAARRNPFLAAERFLARLDMQVESHAGRDLLRDLPPVSDTLVVNGLGVLSDERRAALNRWLERGGHLLIEAEHLWDEDGMGGEHRGDFAERYGARLHEHEDRKEGNESDNEVVATIGIDDYKRRLDVGFDPRFYLEDADGQASAQVVAAEYPRLLQYEIGEGILTVTSDNRFLTNRYIGRYDNALFLALLIDPPAGGKVWLLYDSGIPWLGALLWHRAPLAIVSLLCLLALCLWYLGGRLGPFLPSQPSDRRDLLAHLQASARFLWSQGQGSRLTKASGECIEHAWLRRNPLLRELQEAERAAWIAGRAGLPAGDVARLLYPVAVSESDLVADTLLLQRLWSGLSAPGAAVPTRWASPLRSPAAARSPGQAGPLSSVPAD